MTGWFLTIMLANNIIQPIAHPFAVPFANIPTNQCPIAPLEPPQISLPGNQGDEMSGGIYEGQCTTIAAFHGFLAWECDATIYGANGGVIVVISTPKPNQTACTYDGVFHYAWKKR